MMKNNLLRQEDESADTITWIATPSSGKTGVHSDRYALLRSELMVHARPVQAFRREYRPHQYQTALSERQLYDCGIRVISHQADQWLVPLDAADLYETHPSAAWIDAVRARVEELRALAADEQLAYNPSSAESALAFAATVQAVAQPSVFLIGNGNVRLVWQNEAREQIGLQFLGAGEIQYIFFADRDGRLAQTMGNDRADAVMRIVTATGLRHLLTPR